MKSADLAPGIIERLTDESGSKSASRFPDNSGKPIGLRFQAGPDRGRTLMMIAPIHDLLHHGPSIAIRIIDRSPAGTYLAAASLAV